MRKVLLLVLFSLYCAFPAQALEIRYLGHSAFLLTSENGLHLVLDPFSPLTGYPIPRIDADILVSTHEHFDHYNPDFLGKSVEVLLGTKGNEKEWNLFDRTIQGVHLFALPSYHDQEEGKLRGKNSIVVIEDEDLHLAHLGDIGAPPDEDAMEKPRGVDVFSCRWEETAPFPWRGPRSSSNFEHPSYYSHHYRISITQNWPLASCEEFLSWAKAWKTVLKGDLIVLTKEDLPSSTEIWVLKSPQE